MIMNKLDNLIINLHLISSTYMIIINKLGLPHPKRNGMISGVTDLTVFCCHRWFIRASMMQPSLTLRKFQGFFVTRVLRYKATQKYATQINIYFNIAVFLGVKKSLQILYFRWVLYIVIIFCNLLIRNVP